MTATLISLISIVFGIVGANLTGLYLKKYTFYFIGNTIAGAFGSIFFLKTFGRLGFDPNSIISSGSVSYFLLVINLTVAFLGGALAVILIKKLQLRMNNY